MKISATFASDDGRHKFVFDATPYFERATDDDITDLHKIGWGGDYAADNVAWSLAEENPEILAALDYCQENDVGFEVHIKGHQAMIWLADTKPALYAVLDNL